MFLFYQVLRVLGMAVGKVVDHVLFAVVFRNATNEIFDSIAWAVAALVYICFRLLEIVDVASFDVLLEGQLGDVLGPDLDFCRGDAGWFIVACPRPGNLALLASTRVGIFVTTMATVTLGTHKVFLLWWRDLSGGHCRKCDVIGCCRVRRIGGCISAGRPD